MTALRKYGVEITASALTACVVVALIVLLPFPRVAPGPVLEDRMLDGFTPYSIDGASIGTRTFLLGGRPRPVVEAVVGEPIVFTGWAVDGVTRTAVQAVVAVVDGGASYRALPTIPRSDVASKLGSEGYTMSGFTLTLPRCALSAGAHRVAFRFVASDGRGYYGTGDYIDVDVRPAPPKSPSAPCG